MNFLELAGERYSVRSFSDKPVEEEKLKLILEAAGKHCAGCSFAHRISCRGCGART